MNPKNKQSGQAGIVAVVVIIIIIIAGYYLLRSPATPEVETPVSSDLDNGVSVTTNTSSTTVVAGATTTGAVNTQPKTVIVTYTNDGFTPSEVLIKKGDAVKFVNSSDRGVWPASATHPTHTVYPEKTANDCLGSAFDACRDLKSGESWSFTFNQVGRWGYHDHSAARYFGLVIVQ